MSDIEYRYLLNRCLRADFSKYNKAIMDLDNGSAVVTM